MDILEEDLEEIQEETVETVDSIPMKSKKIYYAQYDKFISWCFEKNINEYTENVLLSYFYEESKKVKSSTLWAHYSMLKATLAIKKSINISKYEKLTTFIKRKNDGYQPKKSKIFKKEELDAFFHEAPDNQYLFMKVVAIMGIAGACRRYELANMTLDNIQDVGSALIVTVPDTGAGMERSFTIKDSGNVRYLQIFRKYMDLRPYCDHRRLFVSYMGGKCTRQPVGVNKFGRIPSEIAAYLKLPDATEYTGHSFRLTSATLLVHAKGKIATPKNLSSTLTEAYGENSIEAKLEIARKVLGLRWGKEAEDSRTSEITACSSKTPLQQTFSDEGREPSTSFTSDLSENWPSHAQRSSASINLTESYEQFGTETLNESTSSNSDRNNEGAGMHSCKNEEDSAHKTWEQSEVDKNLGESNSCSDVSNMDSVTHENRITAVRLPSENISTPNISSDKPNLLKTYRKPASSLIKNASNSDAYQSMSNIITENAVHSVTTHEGYFTMPADCVEAILPHSISSNSGEIKNEGDGRHISEKSAHGKWEQNESDRDDGDSNSLSDVTDTNLSAKLSHERSSSKSISTQNIDSDVSHLRRTYWKPASSILKNTNISNTDQSTSNETENASVSRASTETVLTDNIRDVEMVLIRLQAEKLLLELDKLKLQRDKMRAEKRNIHLRNSVLSLQKQLISIEFSDKAQTSSLSVAKTCTNSVDTSPKDAVDIKSKSESCVPSVLVQIEDDSDSDMEIECISVNPLEVRHSDILGCDKTVAENVPNFLTTKTARQRKTKKVPSVSIIDNLSSRITKTTSQKTYPSKSVLSDKRAPRREPTSAVTTSEEDLGTEVTHTHYSDISESGCSSEDVHVTFDQEPMRVNELEELPKRKDETGSNVVNATDRSKEKDVQELSPLYQRDPKSIDLHENDSSSGGNITAKKRKRETDIDSTNRDDETLLVHSNVETQFAFIEIREPNFVLKKEMDLDIDSGDGGNDSLADIGGMEDTRHLDEVERVRTHYVDSQSEDILHTTSKRILQDTDDANVNKKVKHKHTSL